MKPMSAILEVRLTLIASKLASSKVLLVPPSEDINNSEDNLNDLSELNDELKDDCL
jgi:hypothetical protein